MKCRECGIDLVRGENITESQYSRSIHKCKKCVAKYNKEYREKFKVNIPQGKKCCYKCGIELIPYENCYESQQSNICKECTRKNQKKYRESHREEVLRNQRIQHAKRNGLGYNELCPNYYTDVKVDYHHINNTDVIPIPKSIHGKYSGICYPLIKHRRAIRKWIRKYYIVRDVLPGTQQKENK